MTTQSELHEEHVQIRSKVPDPSIPPYSAVGLLWIRDSAGQTCWGSAALIDPDTIVTCSHNLVDQGVNQPEAVDMRFSPGWSGPRPLTGPPQNAIQVTGAYYSQRFRNGQDAWDVAVCRLAQPYTRTPPFFYFTPKLTGENIVGEDVDLAGYPGDKGGWMWWDRDQVAAVDIETNTLIYTHDTWAGNSGSPVYTIDKWDRRPRQHGIHVSWETGELRRAVLMTSGVLAWIQNAKTQRPPDSFRLTALS